MDLKRILALLGDYYHPKEWIQASLNQALEILNENETYEIVDIEVNQLTSELQKQPDAVILFKEDRLNPNDDQVNTWMTEEIGQAIEQYVSKGGGWLAWHSGLASYPVEGAYTRLLKGHFEYHPVPHPQVQYTALSGDHPFGTSSFELKDEHYFVKVNDQETTIFLTSKSEEGHSIAGWFHPHGEGRVCCLAPAHNEEGLLNSKFIQVLTKTIDYVSR